MRLLIFLLPLLLWPSPAHAEPKACTAEAMICPDGTAVGRTGPNCEFTPCQGENGNDGGSANEASGIKGTATLGPMCPVMKPDPDEQERCQDKPFQGTLIIREGPRTELREVNRVQTDPDGRFQVLLPPGHYTIVTEGDTMYPRCGASADVQMGRISEIVVHCDTGIR